MSYDIIIRSVPGCGYLPIIQHEDGSETFRGSFKSTPIEALAACMDRLTKEDGE